LPKNSANLERLNLRNNNFLSQDLSFLTESVNLEILILGNDDEEKIKKGIYNKFIGSLDYLSNMKRLRRLGIDETDINEVDIGKLPSSLEFI